MGYCGNTGGGKLTPPKVPPVQHDGAMTAPKQILQEHSAVQEGGGEEATEFCGVGGKGNSLKGVQHLQTHPRDGPVLQIPGESTIGGG